MIVLRGDPGEAAGELAGLAAANDAAGRPWRLAELAATAARRTGPVRSAFVAVDLDDLAARLAEPPPAQGMPGAVAIAGSSAEFSIQAGPGDTVVLTAPALAAAPIEITPAESAPHQPELPYANQR